MQRKKSEDEGADGNRQREICERRVTRSRPKDEVGLHL